MSFQDILDGIAFFLLLIVLYFGWVVVCAYHGPLQ